jgi:hypothetical protein
MLKKNTSGQILNPFIYAYIQYNHSHDFTHFLWQILKSVGDLCRSILQYQVNIKEMEPTILDF